MGRISRSVVAVVVALLLSACGDSTKPSKSFESTATENQTQEKEAVQERAYTYGEFGSYAPVITAVAEDEHAIIYHPDTWDITPTPVVLFATGFRNKDYRSYDTFLKFIATHGYSVIYIPDEGSYYQQIEKFKKILEDNEARFDTSKIGVIGYSSGGGFAFTVLQAMLEVGYGESDRFLFSVDPYFAPYMNKADMQDISTTNVLIMQIGPDGKDRGNDTDPRIVLTMYNLLNASNDKNYIVIPSDNNEPNHGYIMKQDSAQLQLLLKPLDALMAYTFGEKEPKHHTLALEGKDKLDPYHGSQKVLDKSAYIYSCAYANSQARGPDNQPSDIDYCGEPKILTNIGHL